MTLFALALALTPLAIVFALLIWKNMPADISGLAGLLAAIIIACTYFNTPLHIICIATLSGFVASFPISLAMGTANFQILVMAETGAMACVVDFIKRVAPADRSIQMLMLTCGFGILFTSFGAVMISLFPPIYLALGYSVFAAIALPCIGYTGACIYAIMGVPVVIFSGIAGIELQEAGILFASFLPFMLVTVSLACLWIAGKKEMLLEGGVASIIASLVSGFAAILLAKVGIVTLAGILVGAIYVLVLLGILFVRRRPLLAEVAADAPVHKLTLLAAISPWLVLVVFSFITNSPFLPFFDILFKQWEMPLEIIPGRPDKLRVFWQSYFWIPLATLLCAPFLRATPALLGKVVKITIKRSVRPVLAIATFFALSSVYVYSGYNAQWVLSDPELNMVSVLSTSAVGMLGTAYMAAAPFLGLVGGVMSGSQSGSIAMLTKLHLAVGGHIQISGAFLALLSALGGGLAGAISPAKVMNAASVIGKLGEEGAVLKAILGIILLLTALISVAAYLWMYFLQ